MNDCSIKTVGEVYQNDILCFEKIRPLTDGSQPPMKKPSKPTFEDICKLFPPAHEIEAEVLMTEMVEIEVLMVDIFTNMIGP